MKHTAAILVIDDEQRMCDSLRLLLEPQGFDVHTANTAADAYSAMTRCKFDVFLVDMFLEETDGFEIMEQVVKVEPDAPIIVITGNATMETAIKALKMGAYDYLKKPFEPEELIINVQNALAQKRLRDENRAITEQLRLSERRYRNMVQNSPDMIYTLDQEGRFIFVNDAVQRLLGYSSQELVGKHYMSLISGNGPVEREQLFMERRVGELVRKDGSCRFVETSVSPILNSKGRVIGCRGIDRDITQRKKLEIDLVESFKKLQNARVSTILGLAKLAEYRDENTGTHLERMREYARIIAETMSETPKYNNYITDDYIADIYHSSILHDIGKVGIPDSILLKPGKLTAAEFEVIKRHSAIGGDALRAVEKQIEGQSFLTLGKEIAYHHHEKWDGTGYPDGLAGEDIPLSARQVALADVYDALTTKRCYKEAYDHEKAKEIIMSERGRQFDPDVVDAFIAREDEFKKIAVEKRDLPTGEGGCFFGHNRSKVRPNRIGTTKPGNGNFITSAVAT
jgi:PAS domain S-box-containing protein